MSSRIILRMFLYLGIGCLAVIVALMLTNGWKNARGYSLPGDELTARGNADKPPATPTPAPKFEPAPQPIPARAALATIDLQQYPWLKQYDPQDLLINRFAPPEGYAIEQPPANSFGYWLQRLPLRAGRGEVHLYSRALKTNQNIHLAVVDLDVGTKDLQQCADSVIRLRSEYLWGQNRAKEVHFNFTSGDRAEWTKWSEGYRPDVASTVRWRRTAMADNSYTAFHGYLDAVFKYAGTASLRKELVPVTSPSDIHVGDVFIAGRDGVRAGHCLIVVNTAQNAAGRRLFMIAQGFLPAQEMEVLINPTSPQSGAWYPADFGQTLVTPEWTFKAADLRRFP